MLNNKTAIPLGMLSIKAAEDLPAARLVNFDGNLCQTGQPVLGVTTKSWQQGDMAAICFSGIVPVECGSNLFGPGLAVGAASDGRLGLGDGTTMPAHNLDSGTAGQFVRIKL